jgi:hypothetical protein
MKPASLLIITALSVFLIAAPVVTQAKAQQKDSRQVVVNDDNKASNHRGSNKNINHKGSNKNHSNKNRSHGKNKHKNNHSYNNNHRSKKHHGHKRHQSHNIAKALLFGAAVHHAFGRHGSHHNGHAWCPTHNIYHTHRHGYSYNYNYNTNVHYNAPYRVDTFVELAEGRCYKVIEYSNGDERRKRIRDHHCDELDEFEEWDDWDEQQ